MSKLVVQVVDASDLMPKDGQGSASPFVEVKFDGQRQRTKTKQKDLNPTWNEKLQFHLTNPNGLPDMFLDVYVYNEKNGNNDNHNNFLGRVRISGASIPPSESEAEVQRYPLDKRGIFSHISGDIALRVYLTDQDGSNHHHEAPAPLPEASGLESEVYTEQTPLQEINNNNLDEEREVVEEKKQQEMVEEKKQQEMVEEKKQQDMVEEKKQKKREEVRTFHSLGKTEAPAAAAAGPPQVQEKPPLVEVRADFARAAPASIMHMQMTKTPDYQLVETNPPLAARLRYKVGDKTFNTYDLVEQMHYLYVNVVKARELPVMDASGSLDPYVEVKLGNYRGVTKHFEKNQSPVWNQIFAFSKERLQSNLIEVTVKDKDVGKDDFVGKVVFDVSEVPVRVPPDSPLAPQWYRLLDKKGAKINQGEIMLAVWMGTQADESFPEAWQSDAHNVSHSNLANTRSKVYFTPKLYYLRVHVMEAQDLMPSDRRRMPDPIVRVQVGNQGRITRPSHVKTVNPIWDDQQMFVVSEPLEDFIIVTVEDRVGPGKDEIMGRVVIRVRHVPVRLDTSKLPDPRWHSLLKPSLAEQEGTEKKKEKFASRILLRLILEAGYHVLDESTHFSSDLQPSSTHLRKESIGILEVGILSARNLQPMKIREGKTTDAYCVAKYGNKWVRTRTVLDTLHPRWNEQYTWEVYDPCTVITIGVFDNEQIHGSNDMRDQRIGKVRIRLSTLETDRVYTHYYPLLVLQPSGLNKNGELHLALRFTCTAWVNMLTKYGRPLLPKLHYVQPIPVRHIDMLRHQAMQIIAARLQRAEPPLRREVVEYMLDVDYHMWSLRRSKANFGRIMSLLMGVSVVCKWFNDICKWRNPVMTILVHILFLILVCYPELVLPTVFLYLFVIGIWNYRFRPRHPPHMDARLSQAANVHPDELDEEFDSFPTSRPSDVVRMRYDRLRSVSGRVQSVAGDLATQGERAQAILSWRDSRATAIFIIISLIWAVFIYVTPFQVVAVLMGLYWLRHPRFRSKTPSVPVNFFKRLPAKSDMLL